MKRTAGIGLLAFVLACASAGCGNDGTTATMTLGGDSNGLPGIPSDFLLSGSPTSEDTTPGGSAAYTASVTNNSAGTVTLSVSGLPPGATGSFTTNTINFNTQTMSGSGTSELDIFTSSATPPGTYTLTITGTSVGGVTHTAKVTLIVNSDFTISGSPSTQQISAGDTADYTATVSGAAGPITLAVSGLPTDAIGLFDTSTINGSGTAKLGVFTKSTTPPGTYTLTITGTNGDGSLVHTSTVTLVVTSSVSINSFNGTYGISGQGFGPRAEPVGILATLQPNGLGQFTKSEVFVNDGDATSTGTNLTGTYSIDSNNRMTLRYDSNSYFTLLAQFIFGCYLNSGGTEGKCIQEDGNGFILDGIVKKIDTTANFQNDFNNLTPQILHLSSEPVGYSLVSRLRFDNGAATFTLSSGYLSIAGTASSTAGTYQTGWTLNAPDSFFMGTATQDYPSSASFKFIQVNSNLTWMLGAGVENLFTRSGVSSEFRYGDIYKQTGTTFNSSTLLDVGLLHGYDTTANQAYSAAMQVQGLGDRINFNVGAFVSSNSYTYNYSSPASSVAFFNAGNNDTFGQVSIGADVPEPGVPKFLGGFLINQSTGIFLDLTDNSANTGASGMFYSQSGGPFSDSLLGNKWLYLSPTLVSGDRGVQVGVGYVDLTNKAYVGVYDSVGPNGTHSNVSLSLPLTTPLSIISNATTGAGSLTNGTWTWNLFMNGITPRAIVDSSTPVPSNGRLNGAIAFSF